MKTFKTINYYSLLLIVICASAFVTVSCNRGPEVQIEMYELENSNGMRAIFSNYGARLAALYVPSADGTLKNVVWGYETAAEWENPEDKYMGPVVGRYANRIGGASFELAGTRYDIDANEGRNHLHGGAKGFGEKLWYADKTSDSTIVMRLASPDGDQGYPGNMKVVVTYTLTENNELKVSYKAECDKLTIVNLALHNYFNLHGNHDEPITTHYLTINAQYYTPVDDELIPTGEMADVAGTPMDFTKPKLITPEFDLNWLLRKSYSDYLPDTRLSFACELYEPSTGIDLKLYTDQPGLQFYSGNVKGGAVLELQNFPDVPHHPEFPSAMLEPGGTYTHNDIYAFSVIPSEQEQK